MAKSKSSVTVTDEYVENNGEKSSKEFIFNLNAKMWAKVLRTI